MAKNIIKPSDDFDFSCFTLNQPYAIQGGSYFTKLLTSGEQLYVQTPKCFTKAGIVKSGAKFYTDLIFTQEDSCFLDWLGKLETTLHELIYDKRQLWFHNDLDMADIETAFSPPVKVVKSGTRYMVRSNIGNASGLSLNTPVRIFNENEIDLKISDVLPECPVVAILEIGGIRFSSRSFHAEVNVKQMMVIQAKNSFDRCLIDLGNISSSVNNSDKDQDSHSLSDSEDARSTESICDIVGENIDQANADETAIEKESLQGHQTPVQEDQVQEDQVQETISVERAKTRPEEENPRQIEVAKNSSDDTNGESLEEVVLDLAQIKDTVCLKNPNEVYLELYIQAREKAKQARKAALEAYLQAKNIKDTYLLDELDESDEEFEMNETI